MQPNATQRFKDIKDAYEVLSDPQQRATYNRQQARQVRGWVGGHVLCWGQVDMQCTACNMHTS